MGIFSKPPFGLDISDLSIQVTQLNRNKKIIRSNYIDIDSGIIENGRVLNPDFLVEAVKNSLTTCQPKPLKVKEVVASLPDSQLFTNIFSLKTSTESKEFEKELAEAARTEIPLDLDDLYADYRVFNPNTEQQEVLFVAAPKEIVDLYTGILHASGLRPLALDMESGCLGRCLLEDDFAENRSVIIVDIGGRSTIISIFIPEGLFFSMSVSVAGNEFSRKIADELKINFTEADKLKIQYGVAEKNDRRGVGKIIKAELAPIIDAIKEAVDYHKYKLKSDPTKVLVVGGTAAMVGLMEYFSNELGIRVEPGNTEARPMSTSYGLALRGISKDPRLDGINLLPPQ